MNLLCEHDGYGINFIQYEGRFNFIEILDCVSFYNLVLHLVSFERISSIYCRWKCTLENLCSLGGEKLSQEL